jgi:hypothetical protein
MLKRPPHLNLYYIFVTSLVFAVSFLVSLFAYVWIPELEIVFLFFEDRLQEIYLNVLRTSL